ncbi:MAG: TolC family protein [Verrucomicrobia bacterium]|nr:TolC family protein [Verrucomicrobiota bacterium]
MALIAAVGICGAAEPAPSASPIDLPTALRLAGAQNLDVAIARERVKEAKAQHEQARMNYFPWITPGIGYRRHDGNIQDTPGNITTESKQSYGIGAALTAQVDLGDTIYKTLAAKQLAKAAEEGAEAKRQETVFLAAAGYFELARAAGAAGAAAEAVRISEDYSGQVKRAVDAGIAFKGDAFRAEVQVEKNRMLLRQAEEQRRVAAARLAQTLRLKPATDLAPQETELAPLTLVDRNAALDSLVSRALASRPELRQGDFLAQSAEASRKGATQGPLIPTIGASAYFGGLGGGRNGSTGNFGDTQDYFLGLSWKIGAGGLFDRGRERAAESRHQTSLLELEKAQQDVMRQVVEAHTRVHSLGDQLAMAKRALASATELMKLSRERKEFGVGAVLETIQAEQELTRARLDYLNVLAAHNQAQYALQRAVGEVK